MTTRMGYEVSLFKMGDAGTHVRLEKRDLNGYRIGMTLFVDDIDKLMKLVGGEHGDEVGQARDESGR